MSDLIISLIQCDLHWEDPAANRKSLEKLIAGEASKTDLIILPEMFSTGFSMNTSLAEEMDGPSMRWMADQATATGAVITGSLMFKDGADYYNRLIWMRSDGTFEYYDKRHLFTMAGEHNFYTAGTKKLIVHLKNWRICPLICYDLRFPVWSRNTGDYDLLIYVANWPEKRIDAWKCLLRARAIENQAFVAAVNRCGFDGNGYSYTGDSRLINPSGEIIWSPTSTTTVHRRRIARETLETIRKRLPFLNDRDAFEIR